MHQRRVHFWINTCLVCKQSRMRFRGITLFYPSYQSRIKCAKIRVLSKCECVWVWDCEFQIEFKKESGQTSRFVASFIAAQRISFFTCISFSPVFIVWKIYEHIPYRKSLSADIHTRFSLLTLSRSHADLDECCMHYLYVPWFSRTYYTSIRAV